MFLPETARTVERRSVLLEVNFSFLVLLYTSQTLFIKNFAGNAKLVIQKLDNSLGIFKLSIMHTHILPVSISLLERAIPNLIRVFTG